MRRDFEIELEFTVMVGHVLKRLVMATPVGAAMSVTCGFALASPSDDGLERFRASFAQGARIGVPLLVPDDMRALAVIRKSDRTVLLPCKLVAGGLVVVEGREPGHGVLAVVSMPHADERGVRSDECGLGTKVFLEPDVSTLSLAKWNSPAEIEARRMAALADRQAADQARSREVEAVVGRIEAGMPRATSSDGKTR